MLMKKKELLKQSRKLAAVITAVAIMDAPAVYGAEVSLTENQQEDSVEDTTESASAEGTSEDKKAEESIVQLDSVEEAATEEISKKENNIAEDKSTEEGVPEESTVEETTTEEAPVKEEATVEGPTKEESTAKEEPTKEEVTAVEEPAKAETAVEETTEEENTAEKDTSIEESNDEEIISEEKTSEEETTEQPAEEAPAEETVSEEEGTIAEETLTEPTESEEITTEEMSEEPESGWVQDGDNWYYYEDGEKVSDCEKTIYDEDGTKKVYRFDEDGNRLTNQWYQEEYYDDEYDDEWTERYYYLSDGSRAEGFQEIDGETYYFGRNDGTLYVNASWSLYDEESQNNKYYRTDENGKVIKGWYEDDSDKYYYLSDGSRASGVQTIDGKTYLFNESGEMQTDTVIVSEGYLYCFDENGIQQTKQSLEKEGWVKAGENWFYVKDKELVEDDFLTIGQYTYYIGEDGKMCTDTTFLWYDGNHYRVDKAGHLVKGWYKSEEDWYYYGTDGSGARGILTINGKTYLFNQWGEMQTNYSKAEDGWLYYFGEDGVLQTKQSLEKGGWVKAGKNWYYAKDSQLVKGEFLTLGQYIYYMDEDGVLAADKSIELYDEESDKYRYYRADKNGRLIKGWYEDEYLSRYYYLSDGSCAQGFQEIAGEIYYFSEYTGALMTDSSFEAYDWNSQSDKHYRTDEKGKVIKGWYEDDYEDRYYYLSDGSRAEGFQEIDGEIYYFDEDDGVLCMNKSFSIYDQNSHNTKDYRADENGKLIRGWYKEGSVWYYYGTDRSGARGILTINGKTYYFVGGELQTNTVIVSEGYLYYFDENGVQQTKQSLEKDGWVKAGEGWFYVKDNQLVKDKLLTVGQYTYYIGSDGKMRTDTTFWWYDEEKDEGNRYRVDKAGHLVKGWYKDGDIWYYYKTDGSNADGTLTINGKTYLFNRWGEMRTNYSRAEDGWLYYFGADGALQTKQRLDKDGWFKAGEDWFYVKNNQLVKNEFLTVGQYTYFMDSAGKMWTDMELYRGDNNYRLDEAGHLVKGWYKKNSTENGSVSWYYYLSDGSRAKGFEVIDGKKYYFDKWGEMASDQTFCYTEDGDQDYTGDLYYADASGCIVTGWKKLIIDDAINWYYFDKNGCAKTGIQEINGKTYYFDDACKMITNYTFVEDGYLWHFGDDGTQEVKRSLSENGWIKAGDTWYYAFENELLRNTIKKIGDFLYSFDYNGQMEIDQTGWAYYRTDEKGHIVTGWYKDEESDTWYYYGNDGIALEGLVTLNNSQYCFGRYGIMLTNYAYKSGNTLYYFGENGKLSTSLDITTDGWKKLPNGYYYVKDGKLITRQLLKVGQYVYYFNDDGSMATSTFKWVNGKDYRFDSQGHMVTGWFKEADGSSWYYYDENGQPLSGVQKIGNKVYYLSDSGRMYQNKKVIYNGVLYTFGTDGVGKVYAKNGWTDHTYYIENGKPVTGWKKISDKWYYFNTESGEKYSSGVYEINNASYYFNSYGEMQTGSFKTKDGSKLFASASGKIQKDGWYKDSDGKRYYIDGTSCVTGVVYIDGKWNLFRTDGSWMKEIPSMERGWVNCDGTYYYLEKGEVVCNTEKFINGKLYSFDKTGKMRKNEMYGEYFFQNSGAALMNGWAEDIITPGVVRYYDEYGKCVQEGWKKIDGKWYYFECDGRIRVGERAQGDKLIDGKIYHFDSNGASDGKGVAVVNGWNLIGGNYYYIENNKLVKGAKTINGKKYFFSLENGAMARNTSVLAALNPNDKYTSYYAGISGEIVTNKWCDNNQSYAGSDGILYTGLKKINGKTYLFNISGKLYHSCSVASSDGKTIYTINSNGEVVQSQNIKNNGWLKTSDGMWFYAKNGEFVRNQLLTINGKDYYFTDDGNMLTSGTFSYGFSDTGYADQSGAVSYEGWFGSKYFGNGTTNGTLEIDGKYYLFIDGCSTAGYGLVDGEYYYFDGKGNKTLKTFTTGWNKVGTDWYYISDANEMYRDKSIKIGSKYYYFNDHGVMVTDYLYQYRYNKTVYYGSNGTRIKNCWKQVDGKWYYFDANGWALVGKHQIKGKWYIFAEDGCMIA